MTISTNGVKPAFHRDLVGAIDALLQSGHSDVAQSLRALPETHQLLLVGAIQTYTERAKTYGHGAVCVLKQLRIDLGCTHEELATLVERHWRATKPNLNMLRQAEFEQKWAARLFGDQLRAYKAGKLQAPTIAPLDTVPVTPTQLRSIETHRKPREYGGDALASPYEQYFQTSWDVLLGFDLPRANSKGRSWLEASPYWAELVKRRAVLVPECVENGEGTAPGSAKRTKSVPTTAASVAA